MINALVCTGLADDLSTLAIEGRELAPPGAGEVCVRMRAASLNFPDLLMTQGKYQFKPEPPFVPGMEGAGTIETVGPGVSGFAPGDDVVIASRFGMFAEAVNVPASALRPKAPTMTWGEAASYPAAWLTAHVALVRCGQLQRGETLLVHGAAGGVGMAAVDLGMLLGATVIATAGTEAKRSVLQSRGVPHVIDHANGFRDEVKRLTGGRGVDVVYDPVGGDVFDESVRCMAFGGRLLVVGFTSGRIPSISVNMPLIKGFSVVGVRAGEYGRQFPERGRENVEAVEALAQAGKIRPHVGLTVPLKDSVEAFRAMSERRLTGKAVITMG